MQSQRNAWVFCEYVANNMQVLHQQKTGSPYRWPQTPVRSPCLPSIVKHPGARLQTEPSTTSAPASHLLHQLIEHERGVQAAARARARRLQCNGGVQPAAGGHAVKPIQAGPVQAHQPRDLAFNTLQETPLVQRQFGARKMHNQST